MTETSKQADGRVVNFDKYDQRGAYHWQECDSHSRSFNPPLVARYQVVINALTQIKTKRRVLDIGCGDAYLMAQIQGQCGEVYGVDSEACAVQLANKILEPWGHCKVTTGNCYDLPFDDGFFDVVLLTDVIEHLTQPEDCLKQIRRVLNDQGYLIVTTPKFRADRKWDDRHEKEYTSQELEVLLGTFFPKIEMSYFWPLKWSNWYRTRVGWRLCKYIAKAGWNPFVEESSTTPVRFGQLKAICHCQS